VAKPEWEEIFLNVLDQFDFWASRLYEGKPISACIGFEPGTTTKSITLKQFWDKEYSAVLTNGIDTLLVVSAEGHILSHEALPPTSTMPPYSPNRFASIADWTTGDRVAVVLNRTGEILIFKEKQLIFARRSGIWHFITCEPLITQMVRPSDKDLRKAIIESCLDTSFARTGACIGVIDSRHQSSSTWQKIITSSSDRIQTDDSEKARTFKQIIDNKKFQELDRRVRQELLSIDGATVIDHKGHIVSVGAILKIPGGSASGGRLAAAMALGKYGLGIKVSQDGGISGFRDEKKEPIFRLM